MFIGKMVHSLDLNTKKCPIFTQMIFVFRFAHTMTKHKHLTVVDIDFEISDMISVLTDTAKAHAQHLSCVLYAKQCTLISY